jgi:two-component system, cell cycle sensor histidine kinase and response regulator CckA
MNGSKEISPELQEELKQLRTRIAELEQLEISQRSLDKRLQASEQLYHTILDLMSDAIHIVDREFRIIFGNKKFYLWLEELGLQKDRAGQTLYKAFSFLPEKVYDEYRRVFETGTVVITEDATRIGNGEYFTETQKIPIMEEGHVAKVVTIIRDLTEIKINQDVLTSEKNKLQSLIDSLEHGITIQDREYNIIFQNEFMKKLFGKVGEKCYRIYEFREQVCEGCPVEMSFKDGMSHTTERRVTMPSGEIINWDNTATPVRDADGNITACIEVTRDITEHKRIERALMESERYLVTLINNLPGVVYRCKNDPDWTMEFLSEGCEELLGYKPKDLVNNSARSFNDLIHPDDRQTIWDSVQDALREKRTFNFTYRVKTAQGDTKWVWEKGSGIFNESDEMTALEGFITDITERKRAEEMLNEKEEFLSSILENIPHMIFIKDADELKFFRFNKAGEKLLGYKREELIGKNDYDFFPREQADFFTNKDRDVLRNGQLYDIPAEPIDTKSGRRTLHTKKIPIMDKNGKPAYLLGISEDITDLKRVENALRESETKMRSILDNIGIGISLISPDMKILEMNRRMREWFPAIDPAQCPICYRAFNDPPRDIVCDYCPTCKTLQDGLVHEATTETPQKGHIRNFRIVSSPVINASGEVTAAIELAEDITEKILLESQFRQAQKMESVGRLAGGVAHDFNNMLSVIIGYTELAIRQADPTQPFFTSLQQIRKAAQRSADLTRQLLAFARKQAISPQILDLNETVESMLKILRRLIGEDINLAWLPAKNLWPVKVDPSQIDQLLANLCINARDAILSVGKITIETGAIVFDEAYCANHVDCVPGEYVLLAVSDDGCGMNKEIQDKLFEPFFTTKEIGKGTGLGLATVYGIVKQNNGFINVYSEHGHGTTFKIYLPRYKGKGEQMQKEDPEKLVYGQETILLVEDEPAILDMAMIMLQQLGYTVLAASTPGEAMLLAEAHTGEIHMIMTDVVMPVMTGRDLARNLLSLYPHLKSLFMSGYTANVIAHHGVLDEGVNFIQKPFSIQALAAKVREVLDGK